MGTEPSSAFLLFSFQACPRRRDLVALSSFALIMTNRRAQTAPPFIPSQIGSGLTDWTVIASGTFLFLLPVAIFTFLLRNHLLRGMSFGAIRK